MGEEPMEHEDCPRNYLTGSSKAMEVSAALEIILELDKKGVSVESIVSDDDSTMRAHLKHEDTEKMQSYQGMFINRSSFAIPPTASR